VTKFLLKCLGSGGTDLSIAFLYKIILLVFIFIPLGLEITYVWTGDPIWEWASGSQYELMLLSIIILLFGNFANEREPERLRWFDAFLCAIPCSILALGATSKTIYNMTGMVSHTSGLISDLVRLFLIIGGMVIVYKSKSVSMLKLSREKKASIVQSKAFMLGCAGVFPPTLYVGAELTGCVLRNSLITTIDIDLVNDRCGGLFPGAKAVTMHIVILYFIR